MKFSDSVKALLLATIDELAADPEKYAKRPGRDFSRNRKLSFKQLLLMFLTMKGNASGRKSTRILAVPQTPLPKQPFISRCRNLRTGH